MTLTDLRTEFASYGELSAEYVKKQLHRVPWSPVVERAVFILERCADAVVLDVGASGPMHAAIVKVAKKCYGIDREASEGVVALDLDDYHAALPVYPDVTWVICGEVLEHLSNPGWFLQRLRAAYRVPAIITVPNAFNDVGRGWLEKGLENVNIDHVCWYSYATLKTLLTRFGYEIKQAYWYNGRERFAEGLLVVAE